jgi:hypothetical protein
MGGEQEQAAGSREQGAGGGGQRSESGLTLAGVASDKGRSMKSIKRRFAAAPEGTAVLFFIQN